MSGRDVRNCQPGLVVGLNWWGIGPDEMSEALSAADFPAHSLPLWDLERRTHRMLMKTRLGDLALLLRYAGRLRTEPNLSWTVVVSPHRAPAWLLRELKRRSDIMVALLGDDPVYPRGVADEAWRSFDIVLSPDADWLAAIPDGVRAEVTGWGSTLTDNELLESAEYSPERLILVGTPYPERVTVAQRLAATDRLTVQGRGWDLGLNVEIRPPGERLATLSGIRREKGLVVNVLHPQFKSGVNPQFFDFAAAGIPQVVVFADDLDRWYVGGRTGPTGIFASTDLLSTPQIAAANGELIASVRKTQMFPTILSKFLRP
jgi:hypothetical protein